MPEQIRQPLIGLLITTTGGTIGFLAVEAWRPMSGPFWQYVAPSIPTSTLLSLSSLLLLLVLLLSAWVAYLHLPSNPTKFRNRFSYEPASSAHKSKAGHLVCTRCLFSDPPMEVPLYHNAEKAATHAECPSCCLQYHVEKA